MEPFYFRGSIPASKSLLNRALIVKSYQPRLQIKGGSQCEDVLYLKTCLADLKKRKTFDCGEGGTTFRFLVLRLSRETGRFRVKGTERLLSRPQKEIENILSQLGVKVRWSRGHVDIESTGWKEPQAPLRVDASDSSQFLSALFLNSWGLDFDLKIQVEGAVTSQSYFNMTLALLKKMGLRFQRRKSIFMIPKGQAVRAVSYEVESDVSSAFSVAAFAALFGDAEFIDFPRSKLQPDQHFLSILKKMGTRVRWKAGSCCISGGRNLKGIRVNLQACPDLFPVLAVLCALAKGTSILDGAPQLKKKESNRIMKTRELLGKAGFKCRELSGGLEIRGNPEVATRKFTFDPDNDHRLAMAAALLKYQGFKVNIKNPMVVNKSFPEFWEYVGVER